MADDFKAKVDKGEARYASSGFSGKGFTFDDSEQSESQQVRVGGGAWKLVSRPGLHSTFFFLSPYV